ncbi:MAG: hypothetical protein NZ580_02375 [Bacteroidia bacterium]|nr:hypothetical protein [Bacteroidia bacterium]
MSSAGVSISVHALHQRLRWVYPILFDQVVTRSTPPLREIFTRYPKVVHAFSHAGSLGWVPAVIGMLQAAVAEGAHSRTVLGVFHRGLYKIALSRWLLRWIFDSREPPSFAKVLQTFKEEKVSDTVVFPEGDNCIIGDVYEIRPFRSPKFIELALIAEAPILITVHRGSEEWGKDFYVPSWMLSWVKQWQPSYVRPLMKNPVLNLPLRFHRIPRFALRSALYFPRISYEELSAKPRERWFQLQTEAQRIKKIMEALLTEIPHV